MSVAITVAKAVADHLNTTPFKWRNPVFGNTDNTADHLITDYVTAMPKVAPLVRRTEIGDLKLFVAPPQDTRSEAPGRDRCDRKHQYAINMLVVQRFGEEDADEIQPGHFDEIENLMGFNESILDFWDSSKSLVSARATLMSISQTAYNEEYLKNSNVYMGNTTAVFRVN